MKAEQERGLLTVWRAREQCSCRRRCSQTPGKPRQPRAGREANGCPATRLPGHHGPSPGPALCCKTDASESGPPQRKAPGAVGVSPEECPVGDKKPHCGSPALLGNPPWALGRFSDVDSSQFGPVPTPRRLDRMSFIICSTPSSPRAVGTGRLCPPEPRHVCAVGHTKTGPPSLPVRVCPTPPP